MSKETTSITNPKEQAIKPLSNSDAREIHSITTSVEEKQGEQEKIAKSNEVAAKEHEKELAKSKRFASSISVPIEGSQKEEENIAKSNKSAIEEIENEQTALETRLANAFLGKSSIDANPAGIKNAETSNPYQPIMSGVIPGHEPNTNTVKEVKKAKLVDEAVEWLRKFPGGNVPANLLDKASKFMSSPGIISKAKDKIRNLPWGNATLNAISKTFRVVFSKPVIRGIKAASAVVSMVGLPVVGVISLGAIGLNVLKETLDEKEERTLDAEKKRLENIKENKRKQLAHIINNKESVGKDSPELKDFLDSKIPNIYKNPPKPSPDKPFEGSRWKEIAKSFRDSMLATTSFLTRAVESGSVFGIVAGGFLGVVNVFRESNNNLDRRERINDKNNEINNLKLSASPYENEKELKELERQEMINTRALEELILTPEVANLSKKKLQEEYAKKRKEIGESFEFDSPTEKTTAEKILSKTKEVAECVFESQVGEVKAVFNENSREREGDKRRKEEEKKAKENERKAKENERTKAKAEERKKENIVGKEKANEARKKLDQSTGYKNNRPLKTSTILPSPSPNAHTKDHGSNR